MSGCALINACFLRHVKSCVLDLDVAVLHAFPYQIGAQPKISNQKANLTCQQFSLPRRGMLVVTDQFGLVDASLLNTLIQVDWIALHVTSTLCPGCTCLHLAPACTFAAVKGSPQCVSKLRSSSVPSFQGWEGRLGVACLVIPHLPHVACACMCHHACFLSASCVASDMRARLRRTVPGA